MDEMEGDRCSSRDAMEVDKNSSKLIFINKYINS